MCFLLFPVATAIPVHRTVINTFFSAQDCTSVIPLFLDIEMVSDKKFLLQTLKNDLFFIGPGLNEMPYLAF